jgi:glycosyltransferase involved in cell wall biosynthesis
MPQVSVIMLVFNGEDYLQAAIDSIINQTFNDFELIIIDDGSTDKSLDKIRKYSDNRIRLIINETNQGIVKARNVGLSLANGTYIACMDCDDISYPVRLEEQVAFMEANPEFGAVGSWFEVIDECGNCTGEIQRLDAPPEFIPSILMFNNYMANSSILIRKTALPREWYRCYPGAEDYDLLVRISQRAKVVNLPKVLLKYRIHSQNVTSRNSELIEGYVKSIVISQLARLHLDPTDDEIEIHRLIVEHTSTEDPSFIDKSLIWLNKIREQNKQYKIYDEAYLDMCIGSKWLWLILSSGNSSIGVVTRVATSIFTAFSVKYVLYMLFHRMRYTLFGVVTYKTS